MNGAINLGDDAGDVITVTGGILFDEATQDLNLSVTDQTVGAGTLVIPDLAGGTETILTNADIGTIASQDANSVNITGGSISGANIDVTGQTLTLDNDQISGDKVEGGTINSVTINTASIGTLGSALDANSQSITNLNVDGGVIDGTVIGGTVAAAGNFTNVDASGTLNADGSTTLNGAVTLGDNIGDIVTVTGTVQGLTTNNDIVFDEATNDLTLAVADQASGVATLTVPDLGSVSGDIVVNNASQTLTNKNLVDNSTVLEDETDNTKQLQFELSGITSGNTRTLTVPDANGTISLTTDFDEASEISYDNTTSGLTATNVQAAIDELDNALDGGVATPTLQQVYTQGNTITTNATDGSVTIAGDQALNVSTSGGLNVTSLLDVDNLRLDGNTVSSTSGDLLIAASSNLDLEVSIELCLQHRYLNVVTSICQCLRNKT